MGTARAAQVYEGVDDVWIVTSYFNPVGYRTRARNYEAFRQRIVASGLNLLTVECVFGDDRFTLPPTPDVLQVRAQHVLWQKERLLNLALPHLPERCTKVAWVDGDVLFENPAWVVETSRLLEDYPVVQPFATAIRLPRDRQEYLGDGDVLPSFGAVYAADPGRVRGGDYDKHGETGLAWAARRTLLAQCGLYDACIIGGGDHVIAHAMCGDWTSVCIDRLIGGDNAHRSHVRRWAAAFYPHVRGAIGYVPGSVLHLWHGERAYRRYSLRHKELDRFGFDPDHDLRVGEAGCWEWARDKPEMHRWAAAYFAERLEDGAV